MSRSQNSPTSTLQVAEDIVPIGELKGHLSETKRALWGRRRPLIVTQNGKAAAVMLAPEDFDRPIASRLRCASLRPSRMGSAISTPIGSSAATISVVDSTRRALRRAEQAHDEVVMVRWRERAASDLTAIGEYIAAESPTAARAPIRRA